MPFYHPLKKMEKPERVRTTEKILQLRDQLSREIPQKTATETLLLATWNIRKFGDNRRQESLYYIAEIISRFDLVAIQEVTADLKGLDRLLHLLGPNWDYIVTDQTDGGAGAGERLAFVYDKCKIIFRKMAGEIVLPADKLMNGLQFARTPYCVSFQAGWFKFMLTTVHIFYGSTAKKDMEKRAKEIFTITSILANRGKKEDESYILLGDFNIPNVKDNTMVQLENNGFTVPDAIKEHPTDLGATNHYDQIAFNVRLDNNKKMTLFSEKKQKAGALNFTKSVYTKEELNYYKQFFLDKIEGKKASEIEKYYLNTWRTFEMSDHLPLWVELKVDFSNQFLENVIAGV